MAIETPPAAVNADTQRLHEMGYAQELSRKMGWFSNFAISFSIISILAGGDDDASGSACRPAGRGPSCSSWIIVGFFALLVGMAMGEICSTYPTAGGLYYWSAKLARKNAPMWSWYTGWFNLIGQIGVIASASTTRWRRSRVLHQLYRPGFRSRVDGARNIFLIFCGLPDHPRAAEHVRRRPRGAARRHQRVVARRRRRSSSSPSSSSRPTTTRA